VWDAQQPVRGWDEKLLADNAFVLNSQTGRRLIDDAVFNQWKTSLGVICQIETWVALPASLVETDVGSAVGNDRPAIMPIRRQLVVGGASAANNRSSPIILWNVGDAELDVWNTTFEV